MNYKRGIIFAAAALTATMLIGGYFLFQENAAHSFFNRGSCFWYKQAYAVIVLWGVAGYFLRNTVRPLPDKYGVFPVLFSMHLLFTALAAYFFLFIFIFMPDTRPVNTVFFIIQALLWIVFFLKLTFIGVQEKIISSAESPGKIKSPDQISIEIKLYLRGHNVPKEVADVLKKLKEYLSFSVPPTDRVLSSADYGEFVCKVDKLLLTDISLSEAEALLVEANRLSRLFAA